MKTGLLIVGHGSRSLQAQETFQGMVELVRSKSSYSVVEGAHMELAQPNIPSTVETMANQGIEKILIIPYFLYEGIHIKEDIPEIIERLQSKHPNIVFKMGEPIGVEPLLADIILKRAERLLESRK